MSWWLESIDLIGSTLVGAAGRLLEGIMQAVAPDTAAETEISIAEPAGSRGLIELDEVDGSGTTPQQLAREDKLRAFFSTWGKKMMSQTPAAEWMTEVHKLLKEFVERNIEIPAEIVADLSEWISEAQAWATMDWNVPEHTEGVFLLPAKKIVELKPGAEPDWKNIEHEERKTLTTEQARELVKSIQGARAVAISDAERSDYVIGYQGTSFVFTNLQDLVSKLEKLGLSSVSGRNAQHKLGVLEIIAHGNENSMALGKLRDPVRKSDPPPEAIIGQGELDNVLESGNVIDVAKILRTRVAWAETSIIVLNACVAGNLMKEDSWPQQLADLTGAYVLAPGGFSGGSLLNDAWPKTTTVTRTGYLGLANSNFDKEQEPKTWHQMIKEDKERLGYNHDSKDETWYLFTPTIQIPAQE